MFSIIQIVQPHFAQKGQNENIIRVEQCHLVVERYRGGHPVPRAQSLYDGGLHKSTNTYVNAGFFSLLFTFFTIF